MDRTLVSPDVVETLEQIGSAELVIGIPTAGSTPAAAQVAAAARAGLEAQFPDRSAVVLHVDATPAADTVEEITRAVAPWPVVQLQALGQPPGPEPSGSGDAIRAVLATGVQMGSRAIVVLNGNLTGTTSLWSAALVEPILKQALALVLPIYQRARYDGTLTQALVVPLVRALYGKRLAHPLAEEFACSAEAAAALLDQDTWDTPIGRDGLELWLPPAAIERGLSVGQAVLGQRRLAAAVRPAPLGATVGRVAATLFTLAERHEGFWIDVRGSEPVDTFGSEPELMREEHAVDPERLIAGFQQGVRDLYPVWERILAPDTLGEVLGLGEMPTDRFRVPDTLWTRVVYDFLLGYRFSVVHRSHLAQSLAPLYLGRTASVVLETRDRRPEAVTAVTERLARQFEQDKTYLVDRWH